MTALPVLLDRDASDAEVEAVRIAVGRRGATPIVRAVWEKPPQTGNGPFWMVLILLGVGFKSFADGFLGKLGEDTADALRDLVDDLRTARRGSTRAPEGWVEFDDVDGTNVMFASGLPDAAYRALLDLDWDEVRGGMLIWDDEAAEWYDPNRRYG